MSNPSTPRVCIVTGAGRRIAQGIAEAFAGQGDAVSVIDLMQERANETAKSICDAGGKAIAIAADVGDEGQVQRVVASTIEAFGHVDVLINAAGGYGKAFRATHETPVEEWDLVFDSNLKGTFLFAKAVLPHMMAQNSGCIVNFSSNAGRQTSPLLGASYTAVKAGVIGFTRHLSQEYGRYGIRVNTIAPGPVNGDRVDELMGGREKTEALIQQIPLGRLAEPEDISDAVIFLASDKARFMTGAIIDVNGGYVLP